MRRPNLCSNSIGVAEDTYKPANTNIQPKEEGRLSIVRRVLGGSRKKDGNGSTTSKNRQFGVPLCDLQLNNNSVPKVLHRICFFIEAHGMKVEGLFRLTSGNQTMVENLKMQFNTDQDFDLEGCNDVASIALLLISWLKDLPNPLFSQDTIGDLISLMNKYEGDTWWGPVCHECLVTAGTLQTNILETILHVLYNYTSRHPSSMSYIPGVFCPLLTCPESKDISSPDAVKLTTKLIQDYNIIFRKRSLDTIGNGRTAVIISDYNTSQKQRKRKERQDSCNRLDRKFVRSNSEERPAVNTSCTGNARAESMRRVSSHEDFSKTRANVNKSSDTPSQLRKMALPLHERNSCSPQRQHPQESMHLSSTVGYASDLYDENEHERRRNSERFAPQRHRNGVRIRRRSKHHHSQAKENEAYELRKPSKIENLPITKCYNDKEVKQDKYVERIKEEEEIEEAEEEEDDDDRSPSPISGVCSPTLDMTLFSQEMGADPVPSMPWTSISPSEERLVSPRNSLIVSRRTFTASLAGRGILDDDPSLFDIATQINNIKRKIKKYDEGFEREFGHKPSHAEKISNPDTKKLCIQLTKLKKQLKSAKEECMKANNCERKALKEEVIQEIEKRLTEKRVSGGRGDELEMMTHDQLVEEKVAIQKVLLQLEASFGRPSSKEERDMVRNLYDRYRTVKRILLRHAPSKLKDSISELGTILEHEAMDFTASSPLVSPGNSNAEEESPPAERKTPEPILDNLHSLPPNELLQLQKVTREEKRRLQRNLREYEHEFQVKTGRRFQKEDRCPYEPTYVNYKQVKAKLRFIDALVTKIK
ncbi:protein FAM13A isoform X2 [Cimex lectularius]|nr:protein FAM13A isoform X2 [Cimex lectularius]